MNLRVLCSVIGFAALASCGSNDTKLSAKVESVEPKIPQLKTLHLYTDRGVACITPASISLIRNHFDPNEQISVEGNPSSRFYHGFAHDSPVLMIDEKGIKIGLNAVRNQRKVFRITYTSCEKLISKKIDKLDLVTISMPQQ